MTSGTQASSSQSASGHTPLRVSAETHLFCALSLARVNELADAAVELRSAARAFAVESRCQGVLPEHMIVVLKEMFHGVDHHTPTLSDPWMLEHKADEPPLSAEWYPELLALCIEAYFEP